MVFEKRFMKIFKIKQRLLNISGKNIFYVAYFYTFAKNYLICTGH